MSDTEKPTIAFDFRVSARVIVGEEHVTEESLDRLEEQLLDAIKVRLAKNVISTPKVAFEVQEVKPV